MSIKLYKDLFPISVQLVLTFAPDTNFKSMNVAYGLSEDLVDIFPNEPNIISLPPNVPLDVPRIIFEQKGFGSLTIGLLRADLNLEWNGGIEWADNFIKICHRINSSLLGKFKLRVHRIGLVITSKIDNNVKIADLKKKYVLDDKLSECQELQIAWHREINSSGLNFNRWVRLNITDRPGGQRNIIIDQNTFSDRVLDIEKFPVESVISIFMEQIRGDLKSVIE